MELPSSHLHARNDIRVAAGFGRLLKNERASGQNVSEDGNVANVHHDAKPWWRFRKKLEARKCWKRNFDFSLSSG